MAPLPPAAPSLSRQTQLGDRAMLDLAYIALALASFALFGLAVRGCARL
jgi:hypothetical protein